MPVPLPSDAVTWAHRLRAVGYDVVLSGKQHFCGPDQLHGFRTQLARDLHAELWTKDGVLRGTPDWSKGTPPADKPWGGVAEAGPGTTLEIEVDDLVEEQALAYLRDPARKERPWALNVSFIAPHFPLVVPERFFNLYPLDQIDMPEIPPGHLESQHPVHQRMRAMFGGVDFPEEQVRRARAGYYGLITYLDEKIGRLLAVLEENRTARQHAHRAFQRSWGNETASTALWAEIEHVRGVRQSAATNGPIPVRSQPVSTSAKVVVASGSSSDHCRSRRRAQHRTAGRR